MKRTIIFIAYALCTLISFGQTSQAPTARNWSPEQCMKLKNITAVKVSPDGGKVLYIVKEALMTDNRSEYVNQVWLCNSDGSRDNSRGLILKSPPKPTRSYDKPNQTTCPPPRSVSRNGSSCSTRSGASLSSAYF